MRLLMSLVLTLLSSYSFAVTTFKVATLTPDGSFWVTEMRRAADVIDKKTDGRVKFRFYPGGVMGNDASVLRKMRLGQLQGAAIPGGSLARYAPDTQLYNIPLLFNNYAEADYVRAKMDGAMEQAFENAGFVNFGLGEGGYAYVMSKKPIASVDVLGKNKIWAPNDDSVAQAAAEAFKFSPVALSVGDVLTGLQTDLIDTVTISPVVAIALQWHTQIKYITNLPLVYFYAVLVVDKKVFEKLDAADQVIVRQEMRQAFVNIGKQNRIDNDAAFDALKQQNIELITPNDEQLAEWKKVTQDASRLFIEKASISPELLKQAQQLLAEFRAKHAQAD